MQIFTLKKSFKTIIISWDFFCHRDLKQTIKMYVYKVVVGVDLINELLRKIVRGGGLF